MADKGEVEQPPVRHYKVHLIWWHGMSTKSAEYKTMGQRMADIFDEACAYQYMEGANFVSINVTEVNPDGSLKT